MKIMKKTIGIVLFVVLFAVLFISINFSKKIINYFKEVKVTCMSYNGDLEVIAEKFGKNIHAKSGILIFYFSNPDIGIISASNDIEYIDSYQYKDAELIRSMSARISLTLMPDKMHAIASFRKGNNLSERIPVLCFNTKV